MLSDHWDVNFLTTRVYYLLALLIWKLRRWLSPSILLLRLHLWVIFLFLTFFLLSFLWRRTKLWYLSPQRINFDFSEIGKWLCQGKSISLLERIVNSEARHKLLWFNNINSGKKLIDVFISVLLHFFFKQFEQLRLTFGWFTNFLLNFFYYWCFV